MKRLDLIAAVVGFSAFEYGMTQWSHAAAWIVGGALVTVAALWPTARKAAP